MFLRLLCWVEIRTTRTLSRFTCLNSMKVWTSSMSCYHQETLSKRRLSMESVLSEIELSTTRKLSSKSTKMILEIFCPFTIREKVKIHNFLKKLLNNYYLFTNHNTCEKFQHDRLFLWIKLYDNLLRLMQLKLYTKLRKLLKFFS